jgi:hypothetical protein
MKPEPEPEPEPSLWDRWDKPTKVLAAIAAVIAALAAAVATGAALFGGDSKTVIVRPTDGPIPVTPLAGQRIRACMTRHHLRAPRVSLGARNEINITFKRCDWPR